MSMLPISILMALTFWSGSLFSPAFANSSDEPVFTQALESFKSGDFTQSRTHFSELLTQHPNDPVLLYNLGLVEMSDQHPGKALGYWRKALYLQPNFAPALSGIRQVHKVFHNDQDNSFWNELYWRIPLWFFLSAAFIFFISSGLLWILHCARRKQEKPSSLVSPLFTSLLFLFFAGFGVHSYVTYYDTTKATVMEGSLAARSSPSEGSPSLVNFSEGDEVVVLRRQETWLQVQKTATALGWVPETSVLLHSGF